MSNETPATDEQVATLKAQVFALVKACPAGRVTIYGLIATPSVNCRRIVQYLLYSKHNNKERYWIEWI